MLMGKECKRILFSKVYFIFVVLLFAFYLSQLPNDLSIHGAEVAPEPGMADYGYTIREEPDVLMPEALSSLVNEYLNNTYTTYPTGFIKMVHLKDSDRERIRMIIAKITGLDPEAVDHLSDNVILGSYEDEIYDDEHYIYDLSELQILVSYEDFLALMDEADQIIGGGSHYARESIVQEFSWVPMTYEEAKAEYDSLVIDDKVTNGYARLFCDYHGIALALLPVFIVAVYWTADKRGRMQQIIYSRQISSFRIVITRFVAMVIMMLIPVMATAFWTDMIMAIYYPGMDMDHLAMYKYTLLWLLPTIIAVTGIDILVTEIFSGIVAVLLQFAWSFACVMRVDLSGDIGLFQLVVRHNTPYERELFLSQIDTFIQNRIFFTILGIVAALLTVIVYRLKREGKYHGLGLFDKLSARKSKS